VAGPRISIVPPDRDERASIAARPRRLWRALREHAALLFVLGAWLAMLACSIAYIARFGSPIPFFDEMEVARYLDPGLSITLRWLWEGHNEHRIPIAKLVYLGLASAFSDTRAVMYADAAALGIASLALILAARRIRGRTSFTDAFFPLVWLHLGNPLNLLSGFQISLELAPVIVAIALALAVRSGGAPTRAAALGIGACIALLPLNGGHGMAQLPPLLAWLAFAGFACARSPDANARASGRILLASGIAAAALGALYFVGYEFPAATPHTHEPSQLAATTIRFLSLSVGPATAIYWPVFAWIVSSLCAVTLVLLVHVLRTRPAERVRASALLAAMCAVVCMGLTVGWARAGLEEDPGVDPRYVTLPTIVLCAVYLAWCAYGSQIAGGLVQLALLSIPCVLLPFHTRFGLEYGRSHKQSSDALTAMARSGARISSIAREHWPDFYHDPIAFAERLRELANARFAPFDESQPASEPSAQFDPASPEAVPAGMRALKPIIDIEVDGERVRAVRPPGEVRFVIPAGARSVHGGFGIHPRSRSVEGRVSARFSIELVARSGSVRVLLDRTLDPAAREADRGIQSFAVSLPDACDDSLLLRTSPVPGSDPDMTWSFWTDAIFSAEAAPGEAR
jgi:hypothetical protein